MWREDCDSWLSTLLRHNFIYTKWLAVRCRRKYAPGETSSPGGSGSRVFSPPGSYARSCFQDGSSAPRTNAPGMRYRRIVTLPSVCAPNYVPAIQQQSERNDHYLCYCVCLALPFRSKEKHQRQWNSTKVDQRGHLLECLKKSLFDIQQSQS